MRHHALATRAVAVLVVATTFGARASAQLPGSAGLQPLGEFLRSAALRNFDNREGRALLAQREHEASEARSRLLPSLTVQSDYINNQYLGAAAIPIGASTTGGAPATRNVVITPLEQHDLSASVTLPLLDLASWSTVGAANATREAQRAQVGATQLEVQKTVARTWYQLVGAAAVARAARRTLAAARDNASVIATRVEAGLASELDAKRALAEVERDRQAIEEADYTVGNLSRSLATVSGLAPAMDTSMATSSLPSDDLHAEAPLSDWLTKLNAVPSVEAANHDRQASSLTAAAARAALLPSVSAQLTERATNATGFGQSPYHVLELLGTWTLDASDANSARAQASAAEAAAVRAEHASADASDAVTDAWQHVQSQIAEVRAARSSLDASRAAAAVARRGYESGRATMLDVVQADRDAFSAEVTTLQAEGDLAWARANLRLTAGRSLEVP